LLFSFFTFGSTLDPIDYFEHSTINCASISCLNKINLFYQGRSIPSRSSCSSKISFLRIQPSVCDDCFPSAVSTQLLPVVYRVKSTVAQTKILLHTGRFLSSPGVLGTSTVFVLPETVLVVLKSLYTVAVSNTCWKYLLQIVDQARHLFEPLSLN
jgi:hypothetical protein